MTVGRTVNTGISLYPDGNGWRVRVDLPDEAMTDQHGKCFVDGKGLSRREAADHAVQQLLAIAGQALHAVNALTKQE